MAGLNGAADIASVVGTAFVLGAARWGGALRPLNKKVARIDGAIDEIKGKMGTLQTDVANVSAQVEGVADAVVPLLADHYAVTPKRSPSCWPASTVRGGAWWGGNASTTTR